jgi:hypothetical protein
MKEYADLLLRSMAARDPWMLPLADRYAATENSVAGSLNMMSLWRTVTGVKAMGQCFADPVWGQLLVTANLDEGGSSTVFCGRMKVESDKISELELYNIRCRADAGFVFAADEMGAEPMGWTSPIPPGGKATREELHQLGRAIFDASLPAPDASPDCILMEAGGIVWEDPDYLDALFPENAQQRTSRDKVTIPAGLWPGRPSDPNARVVLIDEEQGVVVAMATIPGVVSPYLIPGTTESCFVPAEMIHMHNRTLSPEKFAGRQALIEMPAVATSVELVRLHSGELQGLHMFHSLQGPGGGTPWIDRMR